VKFFDYNRRLKRSSSVSRKSSKKEEGSKGSKDSKEVVSDKISAQTLST